MTQNQYVIAHSQCLRKDNEENENAATASVAVATGMRLVASISAEFYRRSRCKTNQVHLLTIDSFSNRWVNLIHSNPTGDSVVSTWIYQGVSLPRWRK